MSNVERLKAEVAEESTDITADAVEITLEDVTVRVLPPLHWRKSALTALQAGDFDGWAEGALVGEDLEDWYSVDPTLKELNDALEPVLNRAGGDLGESRASRRSLRNTRGR